MSENIKARFKSLFSELPKRCPHWPIGIGFLAICAVLAPVLFFGQAFGGSDQVSYSYPFFYTLWNSLRGHGSLAWDTLRMGGFPLEVGLGQYGGLLDPVNIVLFKVLPFFFAYHSRVGIDLILTFLLSYIFIWRLTSSRLAAFLGGSIYAFNQFVGQGSTQLRFANTFFIIPALFLLMHAVLQNTRRLRDIVYMGLGGLAVAWCLVSGDAQILAWTLLAAGFFALSFPGRWKACLVLAGSALLGFTLMHRQILNSLRFSAFTARQGALDFASASVGAVHPLALLRLILPELELPYIADIQASIFFGTAPLFLILAAFILWRKLGRQGIFFLCLAVAVFSTVLPHSPIFWVLHQLPVLQKLRGAYSFLPLFLFSCAVLAAYGYRLLRDATPESAFLGKIWSFGRWLWIGILSLSFLVTLVSFAFREQLVLRMFSYASRIHPFAQIDTPGPEYYIRYLDGILTRLVNGVLLTRPSFYLSMAAFGIALWAIRRRSTGLMSGKRFGIWMVLVTLGNLLPLHIASQQFVSQDSILQTPATIQALKKFDVRVAGAYRVFSFLPNDSVYKKLSVPFGEHSEDQVALWSSLFSPATFTFHNIASIDGYDSFMPLRNAKLLAELGSDRATAGDLLATRSIPLEEKQRIFLSHLNTLGMLNVRYIASLYPFEDARLSLIGSYPVTTHEIPVYLYELASVLPQAYVAGEVRFANTEAEAFAAVLDATTDFSRTTIIECAECVSDEKSGGSQDNTDTLQIVTYQNEHAEFTVSLAQSRWLIFGQNNLPGWMVTIDEKPISVYTANYIFQGVRVPAGSHQIRFRYAGIPGKFL